MPLISDSIGRVLGKRYRLLSALGTGASAHVFLAEDVSLQRHVAVKVLQPGLATDEAFLKRFRAEARSVASLNHPHVLRVFDWGEDTDGPYLVLEYLGGGSLARPARPWRPLLSHSQAAQLGTEVAQGLAYAHARGLVHRDIKPANLLFDEEGRVRVADFGVARALAEAAWTEPAGAMVGTARYISPEAAEGKPVDGRADVYSLALVLYEAVTGTVPFVTDTTMGTLAARIGQPLPHDPALGPLDDVLARAAAPDVAARLDAAGLAARLGALAAALPSPAPLPLVIPHLEATSPISGFRAPGVSELTETGVAATVRPSTSTSSTAIGAPLVAGAPVGTKAGPGEIFDAEPYRGPPTWCRCRCRCRLAASRPGRAAGDARGGSSRRSPWRSSWPAGSWPRFEAKVFTPSHPTPALINLPLAQARADVAKVHMNLKVGAPVKSITVGAGDVVSQSPKPGTSLEGGLDGERGALRRQARRDRPVPGQYDLCPGRGRAAGGALPVGLRAGRLQQQHPGRRARPVVHRLHAEPDEGALRQHHHARALAGPLAGDGAEHPADLHVRPGAGRAPGGGTHGDAEPESSTTVPSGDVISTTPASGAQAPYGSAVTVNVSTGPPTTTVPNVIRTR